MAVWSLSPHPEDLGSPLAPRGSGPPPPAGQAGGRGGVLLGRKESAGWQWGARETGFSSHSVTREREVRAFFRPSPWHCEERAGPVAEREGRPNTTWARTP